MQSTKMLAFALALAFMLAACSEKQAQPTQPLPTAPAVEIPDAPSTEGATQILLDDQGITVNQEPVSTDPAQAVYVANDIIYYESGKDFTYGEGSEQDAHTPQEAAAHTVLHITQPGAYSISGKLSLGQIAVDLGKEAKDDPQAVVTLVLNGVDITCQVAPAVIFYNTYECGSDDADQATKDVDTSGAGANVIIADGTTNNVNGSYVARIYKPESVVLNADKTQVEDAKKLHKYDAAFYSKRTMNVFGGPENTGVLNISAENEGLDSELHLTINGGNIHIESGNDGINTNEDGISVTTINGGLLTILVNGKTGEGDGIDSNGWLVINGGTVMAAACAHSADSGIDSDMGIHINGGTVIATGSMLDRIQDGGQNYAVFNFAGKQTGGETVILKNADGQTVMETKPENAYSILIFSSPALQAGTYTLWNDSQQLAGSAGGSMGGFGGGAPGGDWSQTPGRPGDMQPPEDFDGRGEFTLPSGEFTPPSGEFTPPSGGGGRPGNFGGGRPGGFGGGDFGGERSTEFVITNGGNSFSNISTP